MVLNNLFLKTELQQILEAKVPHLKLCSVKKKRNNLICTCHCFIYLEIHLCKMTCLTVPQTILKIAHAVRSFKKQRVSFFIRNEESSF